METLSNQRKELSNYGLENTESFCGAAKFYSEQDVKQFIKDLRDDLHLNISTSPQLDKIIDELAGDKLI